MPAFPVSSSDIFLVNLMGMLLFPPVLMIVGGIVLVIIFRDRTGGPRS